MGKFIASGIIQQNNASSTGVKSITASKQMVAEVKNKITIPMYFYNIIIPQMGSYYDLYPVDFESKVVVCCPLHDEDTPSCRYYPETNSFYCFGCQRGGDTIALHRYFAEKMNGIKPEYNEAVAFLYNYFIKGKETETFIDKSKQTIHPTNERLNTDQEIVKFNIYRVNLEKSISFDNTLKDEVKQQLWREMDIIDCLLSKNLIKATEAEQHLKQKVKELINIDSSTNIKKIIYKGHSINA